MKCLYVSVCGKVLLLVAWIRQPHHPEACCHWNFGARQFHGGSSEDHTSLRPFFVEDGPTGGWGETWQWIRFQIYPVDGRLKVCRLAGEHFQQRCQAYRVQAGGGSVHVWRAFHSGAKSPFVLHNRYLTDELYRAILWNTLESFARRHLGITTATKTMTPHLIVLV